MPKLYENEENSKCQSAQVEICGSGKGIVLRESEEGWKCQLARTQEDKKEWEEDIGNRLDEGKKKGMEQEREKDLLRSIEEVKDLKNKFEGMQIKIFERLDGLDMKNTPISYQPQQHEVRSQQALTFTFPTHIPPPFFSPPMPSLPPQPQSHQYHHLRHHHHHCHYPNHHHQLLP